MNVSEEPEVLVLATPGWGNAPLALAVCQEVAIELGLRARPRLLVLVDDHEQARVRGFRGSPTVTVAGIDVAPTDQIPGTGPGLGYGWRQYRLPGGGLGGVPAREWVYAAIVAAMGGR